MQLYAATVSHMGGALLISAAQEPRSGHFPRGIMYYSNIHKTKVILHPPPGPATNPTVLSKQIIKLYISGITLVRGINSFIKYCSARSSSSEQG